MSTNKTTSMNEVVALLKERKSIESVQAREGNILVIEFKRNRVASLKSLQARLSAFKSASKGRFLVVKGDPAELVQALESRKSNNTEEVVKALVEIVEKE